MVNASYAQTRTASRTMYEKARSLLESNSENDEETAGIMPTGMTVTDHWQVTPNGDNEQDILWIWVTWNVEDADEYSEDTREFVSATLMNNIDNEKQGISYRMVRDLLNKALGYEYLPLIEPKHDN
jgi:hypothetical protein